MFQSSHIRSLLVVSAFLDTCNMLLLTFEQTFKGGVLYDWGGGCRSSEKSDFVSEAHLLAALVYSSCGSFSLAILSSSGEESSQKAS